MDLMFKNITYFSGLNLIYYLPSIYRRLNQKHKINIFISFAGNVQNLRPVKYTFGNFPFYPFPAIIVFFAQRIVAIIQWRKICLKSRLFQHPNIISPKGDDRQPSFFNLSPQDRLTVIFPLPSGPRSNQALGPSPCLLGGASDVNRLRLWK